MPPESRDDGAPGACEEISGRSEGVTRAPLRKARRRRHSRDYVEEPERREGRCGGARSRAEISSQAPSRWSRLGCGCGALMALGLATIVGLAWFGYYRGERFQESLANPERRAAASAEVLGYRELPAGYHPMGGFSIPLVMEMAMLSDLDPGPGETVEGPADAFGRRGFVYMKTRSRGGRERELREYFRGERERASFFQEIDGKFEAEEPLGRGGLRAGGAEVRYVAERGRMELGEGTVPTVLARLLVECDDDRLRAAMWFEEAPGVDGGYGGTPADAEALKRFLDHFRLCGV